MNPFSPTWLLRIRDSARELLPRQNLRCLQLFLAALELRLTKLGVASTGECSPPRDFSEWVASRLGIRGELNAFSLVQLRYGSEGFAFDQFYLLLDQYCAQHVDRSHPSGSGVASHAGHLDVDRTEWLREIYKKPALFLGEKSVTALYAFIQGDRYAISVARMTGREIPALQQVEDRIKHQFGYPDICDARQILLLHSGFDEAAAFEKFYEFLDIG
jgi:hypothetical protein